LTVIPASSNGRGATVMPGGGRTTGVFSAAGRAPGAGSGVSLAGAGVSITGVGRRNWSWADTVEGTIIASTHRPAIAGKIAMLRGLAGA